MLNVLEKIKSNRDSRAFKVLYYLRHPVFTTYTWLYGAYLTLRYVDKYTEFPAITFTELIQLKINKNNGSKLLISGRLIISPWLGGRTPSYIGLGAGSRLEICNDFIIGDDVRINLSPKSKLLIKGKSVSSGSGITCRSVLLINEFVEIGKDSIVSWDTFITDSDHHPIDGVLKVAPTRLRDHVWICVGAKILKGADIGMDSIVAPHSVVLEGRYNNRVLLAGSPASVVKKDIAAWSRE